MFGLFFRSFLGGLLITFKCIHDLKKLAKNDSAIPVIMELIDSLITAYDTEENPYIAEYYGYIILIEEEDLTGVIEIRELNCRLLDVRWEFAEKKGDFYYAACLINDEFGLAFVIPNAEWLSDELRILLSRLLN